MHPKRAQVAVTDAEVRHGMLLLRPRNVVVLNGQVCAVDTLPLLHDTSPRKSL